jgi:hypothetical protein
MGRAILRRRARGVRRFVPLDRQFVARPRRAPGGGARPQESDPPVAARE